MAPKYSPICDYPQKISTKSSYPQIYSFFFLKNKKNMEFKILNQKNDLSLRMY